MSFKQIIQPAFKKGTLLLHVMEFELDFRPLLNHLEKFEHNKSNSFSDFLSVMNSEEGARHIFTIYGDVYRDVISNKAGYYGLPTTVVKDGINVRTFDMSLNSVHNEVGLMFNAYSKNINILYASSNDIKSAIFMKENGSINIKFEDTNLFPEYKHAQFSRVSDRTLTLIPGNDGFMRTKLNIPSVDSLKQPKTVLAQLWKNIEEMGVQNYFKEIIDRTYHHWNEVLISTPLSDVAGVFTTSKYGLEIVRATALAGAVMEKLSTDNQPAKPLPVVFYKNGIMEEIEITRDLFKSEKIRSAVGLLARSEREALTHFTSAYLNAIEKQQSITK
jgi:hypothetical protein